jgi:predicted transcriptional regulator of viral defense system
MKKKYNSYNYLEEYLFKVRSKGRYSVTLTELKAEFDISDKALHQSIFRLKLKNNIAQIRRGFYAIIPPEYSSKGMLPLYLFVDDLMKYLDKKYYVSLYSAAALFGAAHQQPMEYYVMTQKPALRNINSSKINITFFVKSNWDEEDIIEKKTDAGYIKVSSPELTALDLISYNSKIGGINRLLTIIQELTEEIKPAEFAKTAKRYKKTADIQRLGYLIDKELGFDKLANILYKVLKERNYFTVSLSVIQKTPTGEADHKWKIIKNIELESDL